MKDLFHIVDEAQGVIKSGGVFYQRKVYRRANRLYAGHGGGFIRLGSHDATSCPKVSWESLDYPAETLITFDKLQGPVWAGEQ